MNLDFPIHHVIVVGFHHKKGCQVEYAFPPLEIEVEKTAWKHLPTLAIPDGAHNYQKDTVYFHLPSLKNSNETVFGVSCYQQIQSDKLKNRPDDVTRSTVQKSVCILSKYPLFGHIQVKMELITAAYFREGDFDQVSILEEAFHNLNACLTAELLNTPEAFVALSPRDLIYQFRHQILMLFKLLLLEKKILFHGASVGPLCSALLTLISLLPLTVEYGLNTSACIKTSKSMSIVPQFSKESVDIEQEEEISSSNANNAVQNQNNAEGYQQQKNNNTQLTTTTDGKVSEVIPSSSDENKENPETEESIIDPVKIATATPSVSASNSKTSLLTVHDEDEVVRNVVPDFYTAVQMTPTEAGLPLSLFTRGYLCYPYLSLHYLDLLSDSRVRGFVVGATNVLFRQKRNLVDAIIQMEDGSIEILDPNLKRTVALTTADLRFAETIVKQVTEGGSGSRKSEVDCFMDGVGWEGGDEWIRAQFKYYLMCLMRTSLLEEDPERQKDAFSTIYLTAWQNTNNWKVWYQFVTSEERNTPGIYDLAPGHPCEGNMSVSDMKIRFSHTIQNTEGGRRLNQAVANTGKAVAQTSKAVRGVFSSWWSTMTTPTVSSTTTVTSSKSEDKIPSESQNESKMEIDNNVVEQQEGKES